MNRSIQLNSHQQIANSPNQTQMFLCAACQIKKKTLKKKPLNNQQVLLKNADNQGMGLPSNTYPDLKN